MEPFGLFHFLQTLLSQNGSKEPTESPTEPQAPLSKQPADNNEYISEPQKISSSQEAAMAFLYRHEADAKRRKRK